MARAPSAPWRMILSSPEGNETMVEASRHAVAPASIATSTPSSTQGSTSSNDAGAGLPWVLALVTARGQPQARTSAATTGEAEARSATVPSGACMKRGTEGAAGMMSVSAPGHSELASARVRASTPAP